MLFVEKKNEILQSGLWSVRHLSFSCFLPLIGEILWNLILWKKIEKSIVVDDSCRGSCFLFFCRKKRCKSVWLDPAYNLKYRQKKWKLFASHFLFTWRKKWANKIYFHNCTWRILLVRVCWLESRSAGGVQNKTEILPI